MKTKSTQRADGRLCRAITDPRTGKRIYFYGQSERELNKKIMEYTTQKARSRTFGEIAELWWDETYENLASQSLKGYKPALARAIDEFGDECIDVIQPKDIQQMFKKMSLKGYSAKTIANHRIVLNQIFNYAILEGDIQYNPCTSVRIPKEAPKTVREAASSSDEEKILQSNNAWLFPVFALLTGLRKGEILALQWKDIDFDNNLISVTKSVEHINNEPRIKEPKTKSGTRYVPLLQMLKVRLEPKRGKPEHYIFSADKGKSPLRDKTYAKLYKDYSNEVGITCTAHQLRHSYATVAVEEDVNPKDLQNALGHADITTTMNIYAMARKKSVEKVAEKLNNRYKKSEA